MNNLIFLTNCKNCKYIHLHVGSWWATLTFNSTLRWLYCNLMFYGCFRGVCMHYRKKIKKLTHAETLNLLTAFLFFPRGKLSLACLSSFFSSFSSSFSSSSSLRFLYFYSMSVGVLPLCVSVHYLDTEPRSFVTRVGGCHVDAGTSTLQEQQCPWLQPVLSPSSHSVCSWLLGRGLAAACLLSVSTPHLSEESQSNQSVAARRMWTKMDTIGSQQNSYCRRQLESTLLIDANLMPKTICGPNTAQ